MDVVGADDIVILAERMMDAQDEFIQAGKPFHVDLGYHYTLESNIERIRTDGLLTKKERREKSVNVRNTGSFFGDGIYTSDNPFSFCNFGNMGLVVARLQGRVLRVARYDARNQSEYDRYDTLVGNKTGTFDKCSKDEIVLKTCAQALPLLWYPTELIHYQTNIDLPITKYNKILQDVVNEFFNTPIASAIAKQEFF
mmetsp:Transcript_4335/g.7973  ORF Transcript_4335/g.7973 Transcript_4335/m.7973 type:complete len:197 (+) Transcript_4335:131-721(+)